MKSLRRLMEAHIELLGWSCGGGDPWSLRHIHFHYRFHCRYPRYNDGTTGGDAGRQHEQAPRRTAQRQGEIEMIEIVTWCRRAFPEAATKQPPRRWKIRLRSSHPGAVSDDSGRC